MYFRRFFFFVFLFSPFSLLSPRDQIRRSRPLQPTELISLRERGAIRAAEAGDVPVGHLINSLIAAGQKEDPFLRIGESGRQRYKACLRGPPRPRQSVSVCAAPEKGARAPCLVKQSQRARPPRRRTVHSSSGVKPPTPPTIKKKKAGGTMKCLSG